MSVADWWCMCGNRMRYVVGGEWECPVCDHHRKTTPKPARTKDAPDDTPV